VSPSPSRRRAAARAAAPLALSFAALAAPAHAQPAAPAPDPPVVERGPGAPGPAPRLPRGGMTEWVLHRSADGAHPDPLEQQMMWFMNRARQDPSAEGVWLATTNEADIALPRAWFDVDVDVLMLEFAALEPAPPAAFDRRLWDAARLHSEDLIARDAQDHNGQLQKVNAAGFDYLDARFSVFSYTESPLNGHGALNIDWGPGDGTGMQPGRGHRLAIMLDYDNVGIALVPDASGATAVGPLVFSGNYAHADTGTLDHYDRFLVGTVWVDEDEDGFYDPGEGRAGVTVTPDAGSFYAVTAAGGGYAIPITAPGTYGVTFTGGGIGTQQRSANVGGTSVLLDLELPAPEPARLLLFLTGAAVLRAAGRIRPRRTPS